MQAHSTLVLVGTFTIALGALALVAPGQNPPTEPYSEDQGSLEDPGGSAQASVPRLPSGPEAVPCGVRSLALVLAYLGVPVPVAQLRDELEVSEKHETSFHKLASCARRHGMKAVGFKMDLEDFIKLREPVIVRVRTEDKFHFTVALPRPEGIVSIFEPVYSAQPIMVPLDEFAESFTGDVLVVRNRDALPGEELAFMPEPLRSGGAAGQESNQQGSPDRKPRVAIAPATPARSPRGNASKPGSGSNEPNAPRIEFESEALDFGPLHSGEDQMQGVFHFRNTGAATLIIDKIQAGCSCTVSTLAKREYAPGEKGEIGVTVDMSDRLGDFRTRVTVKTNDPKNEEVDLDLHCFVFHDPQVYPDVVSLGTLDVGSELRRSLKVKLPTSPSQPDAEIVAIRTPVAALNCSLLPSSQRIEAAILYDVVCEL